MMKHYSKPTIMNNLFVADECVSACGDIKISYDEQTVNCIIDGDTTIFTDACGRNYASNGQIVDYNGMKYYLWKDGKTSSTRPTKASESLLKGIQNAAGVSGAGWHAATFDAIGSVVTAS